MTHSDDFFRFPKDFFLLMNSRKQFRIQYGIQNGIFLFVGILPKFEKGSKLVFKLRARGGYYYGNE